MVVAVLLFVAAAFGGFIAWVTYWFLCFGESSGSLSCPDGEATTTMTMQLVVALLGVAVAAAMLRFALLRKRRAARAAMLVALATFALWGVLNDATVHGWDRDMIFW